MTSNSNCLYLDDQDPIINIDENNFYGQVTSVMNSSSAYFGVSENEKKIIYNLKNYFTVKESKSKNIDGEDSYDVIVTTLEFVVKSYDYNNEKI